MKLIFYHNLKIKNNLALFNSDLLYTTYLFEVQFCDDILPQALVIILLNKTIFKEIQFLLKPHKLFCSWPVQWPVYSPLQQYIGQYCILVLVFMIFSGGRVSSNCPPPGAIMIQWPTPANHRIYLTLPRLLSLHNG